ncbi:hypothetical protein FIE12Z_3043 [Fusarium flagelliforme]|uniref:Uncharacterized protein n=1 Tax=Fusarium flagelliforme TaxID=2675880 RepID=A0A395MYC2_9HYPO|nr:hypothetical protein FIE12Z_3043 [Fusarium flagelliforme]
MYEEIRELWTMNQNIASFTPAGYENYMAARLDRYDPIQIISRVERWILTFPGRVSMQTIQGLIDSSRHDWLRLLSRESQDTLDLSKLMSPSAKGPVAVPASSTIRYLRRLRIPCRDVYVRHKLVEKPSMETRSVKLAASIIASQEHLPIAEAEETVHFMDRQSGCLKYISREEFKPYFDMLDWCWRRQQEVEEEARSRNYNQIEAKLDSVNFERDIEPSFARRTGDTAESKQTKSETESITSETKSTSNTLYWGFPHTAKVEQQKDIDYRLPDSNETSDTLMTEEELEQAIDRQIFASQRPNSLETMKNKMRDQELSDEQLDDAFAAGLKDELAQWEDVEEAEEVVNEVEEEGMEEVTEEGIEEGIEEGVEDGKDKAQEVDEAPLSGAALRIARKKERKDQWMMAQRRTREAKTRLKEVEVEGERSSEAEVTTPDDAEPKDVPVDDAPKNGPY